MKCTKANIPLLMALILAIFGMVVDCNAKPTFYPNVQTKNLSAIHWVGIIGSIGTMFHCACQFKYKYGVLWVHNRVYKRIDNSKTSNLEFRMNYILRERRLLCRHMFGLVFAGLFCCFCATHS